MKYITYIGSYTGPDHVDGVRIFGVYFSPDAWHVPSDISDEWLNG